MISSATRCTRQTFPAVFSMRIRFSHSDILLRFIHSVPFKIMYSLFLVAAFGATITKPDNFSFSPLITERMFPPRYLFHNIGSYWWAIKTERFLSGAFHFQANCSRFNISQNAPFLSATSFSICYMTLHRTAVLLPSKGKASGGFRFLIRKTGNLSPIRNTAAISASIALPLWKVCWFSPAGKHCIRFLCMQHPSVPNRFSHS